MDNIKIGLEVHIQLNTKSKIFCGCQNPVILKEEPEPNSITCPACLGLPGSKPRVNKKVIEKAIIVAKAMNSKISPEMYFSRKTYFYPDNPKNFQITQYEIPLANGGFFIVKNTKINIRRLHIEEDAAKTVHTGGIIASKYTLIDYNRSGVPVLEIVTEPDISKPEEARLFIQKLITILEYLDVYDSSSKAVLKSDVNISVDGGKRVEIKEITGAKEIEAVIKYEIERQGKIIKTRDKVAGEVRTWNSSRGLTESMRTKEEEEEYGYIFEPDLSKIEISREFVNKIKLPELPKQKMQKFIKKHKMKPEIAESIVSEKALAELFEEAAKEVDSKTASTWIAGYLKKTLNYHNLSFKSSGLKKEWIIDLLKFFKQGKITDRNAELVIRKMVKERRQPILIIKKYKLGVVKLDIEKIVKRVLEKNKKPVQDYLAGKEKALHFLVGQVVRETKGQVNAGDIRKIILKSI